MECVEALAKGQAQGSCPWTHLGGVTYWLILNTPSVPVPSYACSADATAGMSVLTADHKPKYNHATDSQTDQAAIVQSGAVQVSGPVQSAALQPAGVASGYQASGHYAGYGHGYGRPPLCIEHLLACLDKGAAQNACISAWRSSLAVRKYLPHASCM